MRQELGRHHIRQVLVRSQLRMGVSILCLFTIVILSEKLPIKAELTSENQSLAPKDMTVKGRSMFYASALIAKYSESKRMGLTDVKDMLNRLGFSSEVGNDSLTQRGHTFDEPRKHEQFQCLNLEGLLRKFGLDKKVSLKTREIVYLSSAIVQQLDMGCLTNRTVVKDTRHPGKDVEMTFKDERHDNHHGNHGSHHDTQDGGEYDSQHGGEHDSQHGGEHDSQHGGEHDSQHDSQHNSHHDSQHGGEHDSQHGGEHDSQHDSEHDNRHGTQHDNHHGSQHDNHHDSEHDNHNDSEHDSEHDSQHDSQHGGEHDSQHGGEHDSQHGGEHGSEHDSQHDSQHGGEHDSQHGGEHDSQHGGEHGSHHDRKHGSEHDNHHDSEHDNRHGTQHDNHHGSQHDNHHDSEHDNHHGSEHNKHHDSQHDNHHDSQHDNYHGSQHDNHHDSGKDNGRSLHHHFITIPPRVWGFSILAVVVVSLVGLASVAIIPIMTKVFYNSFINFLVAMAIGALTGDAILHLIPHALSGDDTAYPDNCHAHHHSHNNVGVAHTNHAHSIWKGVTSLVGMILFFVMESIITITSMRRKKNKALAKKRRTREQDNQSDSEKVEGGHVVGVKLSCHSDPDYQECEELMFTDSSIVSTSEPASVDDNLTHSKSYKAHSHSHGPDFNAHSHAHFSEVPQSVAAIAWMVIVGDGVHNLSDGLALGAAFSNSITGGISTSIAIFCHELPHEIGDFAVLLRAGMSVKQALVYNCVSSILCFIGMVIGVALGNIHQASLWIFACVAGIFIYIALVDMMPELMKTGGTDGDAGVCRLLLHVLGMTAGAAIMAVIALYEHELMNIIDI